MWDVEIDTLDGGRVRRVTVLRDGTPVPFAETLACWQRDAAFVTFFTGLLADAPFDAYFWEMPPVTRATAEQDFAFVLVESPALTGMKPDPGAFAGLLEAADPRAEVVAFANLGGDAYLIAPCPGAQRAAYPHLAAFARTAPSTQQRAFWRLVGSSLADRLSDRPLWLSTSGLGVAWLHARIDSYPKYYTYAPYRRIE